MKYVEFSSTRNLVLQLMIVQHCDYILNAIDCRPKNVIMVKLVLCVFDHNKKLKRSPKTFCLSGLYLLLFNFI